MTGAPFPPTQQPPAAGWYPDPGGQGMRWWDGNAWTQNVTSAAPPMDAGVGGLVICGYIFAVIAPIVGLILGIVAWNRPSPRSKQHGKWIVLLSVIVFGVSLALILIVSSVSGPFYRTP
ncbi:MAG TPA: DUF2510 domain-containing protein [Candidatus Dormibacteraeota bacterium]|nr:DUF2510 domain-containing protein [Candidatus Dormibacteraeota bacterium]